MRKPLTKPQKGRSQSTADGPSFLLKAGSRFRHFPQLDGLRGSAVLIVVIGHTLVFRLGFGYRWTHFALLGVLVFFVLSGFLITGLLCSEERRFNKISLKNFYLRRVLRILPAFSVFLLIVCVLIHLNLVIDTPWTSIAVSMMFLKNIFGSGITVAHLWSLSLEEQFYLAWPLIFSVIGRRRILAPTLGLILGIVVYRTAAINLAPYLHGSGIFELRSDFRMDSILVGCALALLLDRRPGAINSIRAACSVGDASNMDRPTSAILDTLLRYSTTLECLPNHSDRSRLCFSFQCHRVPRFRVWPPAEDPLALFCGSDLVFALPLATSVSCYERSGLGTGSRVSFLSFQFRCRGRAVVLHCRATLPSVETPIFADHLGRPARWASKKSRLLRNRLRITR